MNTKTTLIASLLALSGAAFAQTQAAPATTAPAATPAVTAPAATPAPAAARKRRVIQRPPAFPTR